MRSFQFQDRFWFLCIVESEQQIQSVDKRSPACEILWRLFCPHKKKKKILGLQSPRCKLIPLEHVKGLLSLGVIYLWRDRHIEFRHCDKNLALNPLQKPVSSRNNSGKHCVSLLHYHLGNYLWSLNIQASKKTLPPLLPLTECLDIILVATLLCLTPHFLNCCQAIQKHTVVSK